MMVATGKQPCFCTDTATGEIISVWDAFTNVSSQVTIHPDPNSVHEEFMRPSFNPTVIQREAKAAP